MTAGRTGAGGGPERIGLGLLLMTGAMVILPGMDALAKLAGRSLPPVEIAFARLFGQMILTALAAAALGRLRDLAPPRFGLHMLRGACLGFATLLFFSALAVMPLADAIAVFFVEPMILTALAALVTKERVGWRRWSACAVGFLGALVVVRPGYGLFGIHSALPLGSAFLFAVYLLLTRRLSGAGSLLSAQFVTGLSGSAVIGLVLAASTMASVPGAIARWPVGIEWAMLAGISVISLIGHGLVVRAFDHAPPSVLAPLNYLEIVSATALGWLVFSDFPDGPTRVGIALIVGSGLYIVHRERVTAAERAKEPAAP